MIPRRRAGPSGDRRGNERNGRDAVTERQQLRSDPTAPPRRRAGFVAALAAAAVLAAGGGVLARPAPDSFADLAEKLLPSVVNISTTQAPARRGGAAPDRPQLPPGSPFEEFFREFFERQQRGAPARRTTSLGSGFVIDAKGLIVTNNHVIAEADEISVILADETRLEAEVVGRDPKTDLALLRVEAGRPLPAVRFGDSATARVGDWVIAIGNPFGLGGTVTAGIVSARHRDINVGPYDDFIQTDASINRGNSGGPIFNLAGEVVGVNTAIYSPSGSSVGIGFAIPSNLARPIVDQLSRFGRARRGWLGVRIQSVTDELARGLGLDKARGALVAGVTEDSPARGGGVRVGDVILTFDAKPVDEMRRLPRLVAETDVGKRVSMEVWRDGATIDVEVEVGEFPDDEPAAAGARPAPDRPADDGVEILGLALSRITPELRERYEIGSGVDGVVVTRIDDDSPAADGRLRPGDVIRKIGPRQTRVTAPSEVKAQIDAAGDAGTTTVLLLVERAGSQRFVAVPIGQG